MGQCLDIPPLGSMRSKSRPFLGGPSQSCRSQKDETGLRRVGSKSLSDIVSNDCYGWSLECLRKTAERAGNVNVSE